MSLTNFPNGISSFGIPVVGHTAASVFGTPYFVNANTGSNDYRGNSVDRPFKTIQKAVSTVSSNGAIYIAPGVYSENVVTEDDTGARNVSIIGSGGASMPGWNGGVQWSPSTSSSPCLRIKASGWRVSGIAFRPGTTSSGIELYSDMTTANFLTGADGSLCRGGEIFNCMFFGNATGKYGIVFQGDTDVNAPHSWLIHHNSFTYLAATGAAAIYVAASGNPVYDCVISFNKFSDNTQHIATASNMGYVGCRFEGNSLPKAGCYKWATVLMDLRSTATPGTTGGNAVVANFFGCTLGQYADDDSTDYVHANGYDTGMGNSCSDGVAAANISNSSV